MQKGPRVCAVFHLVGFLPEYWRVERTDAAESQLATRDEAKLRGGDPRRRLVLQRLPQERTGPRWRLPSALLTEVKGPCLVLVIE